jgi:hypothetical protein
LTPFGAVSCNLQIDEMITGVPWLGVHCGEALSSFRVRNMNQAELKIPPISHLSWGHVEVEGHPPFKDTKVFPGARGSGTGVKRARAMCPAFSLPTFRN